jgi:hypothetical protein
MKPTKRIKLVNWVDLKAFQAVPIKDSGTRMKLGVRTLICRTTELLRN